MTRITRIRMLLTIITLIVVGIFGTAAFYYAKGYRLNRKNNTINPTGLLVIKSDPDGASLYVDGKLKTATNATISLEPGTYDIKVIKEGYMVWEKRMTISKEEVSEESAHLFKSAPSLTAITFSGAINPLPSRDMSKISYVVPSDTKNISESGLWVLEMINLPLGFSRDPRKISNGNLNLAKWDFSPDDRDILLNLGSFYYLIPIGSYTVESQRINVTPKKSIIDIEWQSKIDNQHDSQTIKLPKELSGIIKNKTSSFVFSPDEQIILYTASSEASLKEKYIPDFPGASTQKQERNIKPGNTYTYNIKEDRNFLIDGDSSSLVIEGGIFTQAKRRLSFFPTSKHLILAEESKVTIMDYDGTNRRVVFSGNYVSPNAFPTLSNDRLIILTSLGGDSNISNLYSLGIK